MMGLSGMEVGKLGKREKGSEAGQAKPPPQIHHTGRCGFITKWLSHDVQSQTMCWALGRLPAQRISSVWRSAADTPESPPCYGRESETERNPGLSHDYFLLYRWSI